MEAKDSWERNALNNISVQGSCVGGTARWLRTVWETEILLSSPNNTRMLRNPFLGLRFPLSMTIEVDCLTHWDNDDVISSKGGNICKRDMSQYINGIKQLKRPAWSHQMTPE